MSDLTPVIQDLINRIKEQENSTHLYVFREDHERWVAASIQAAGLALGRGLASSITIHKARDGSWDPCMLVLKQRIEWQ